MNNLQGNSNRQWSSLNNSKESMLSSSNNNSWLIRCLTPSLSAIMPLPNMFNSKDMTKDSQTNTSREDHQEKDSRELTIINQGITTNPENTIKEIKETKGNINREILIINRKVIEEEISMRREPMSSTITKVNNRTTSNISKDIKHKASSKPTSSKDTNSKVIKLKDSNKLINSKATNLRDISNIKEIKKNIIYGINSIPKLEMWWPLNPNRNMNNFLNSWVDTTLALRFNMTLKTNSPSKLKLLKKPSQSQRSFNLFLSLSPNQSQNQL